MIKIHPDHAEIVLNNLFYPIDAVEKAIREYEAYAKITKVGNALLIRPLENTKNVSVEKLAREFINYAFGKVHE